MIRLAVGTFKQIAKVLVYGLIGAFAVLLVVAVYFLESRPELKVWHTVELDEEFTVDSGVTTFEEYLALEDRLFEQLERRVCDRLEEGDRRLINRFHRGSMSDPQRFERDWNRTWERSVEEPRAGVLLLHGMSDSPYSLLSLGRALHSGGAWVVGLRLPGHGTAPAGLTRATYEDMAAATLLAVRHLREKIGERPLHIVGYSNGAALAVHYSLEALADSERPRAESLVLISPAIGVAPAAALAVWQARLGRLLGLEKLAWNSIVPEYDPFKYNSFAVNAGNQVHRLTAEIAGLLGRRRQDGTLGSFPRVLAFQSAVDATVSTPALITGLMARLLPGGHELVLFDVNRSLEFEHLLTNDPKDELTERLLRGDMPFFLGVITNESEESRRVELRWRTSPDQVEIIPLDLDWPADIYSLSHVALPFPSTDPLYGRCEAPCPGVMLGNVAMRGERGALRISAADMLRLRWNPFYSFLAERVQSFTGLAPEDR